MKKLMFLPLLMVLCLNVNAQNFGIKAGANFAKFTELEGGEALLGLHAGLVADFPINESLSVLTGVEYNAKGVQSSEQYLGEKLTSQMILNYIQLPLALKGNISAGENINIFALAGPYVGYAVNGKLKLSLGNESESEDLELGTGDGEINPLDYGLTLGAGVQFSNIFLSVGYDLGLSNLSNDEDDPSISNRVLKLSAGYMF